MYIFDILLLLFIFLTKIKINNHDNIKLYFNGLIEKITLYYII